MKRNTSRNASIDAVRALACVSVLFIHCRFPYPFTQYLDAVGRYAVPFFLMVSGYFCCRGIREETLASAKKHLLSTLRLTLWGVILYAVSNTCTYWLKGREPFAWLDSLITCDGVYNFFVYNRAVFLSSVMYYLFMLIYVYAIFWALVKTNTVKYAEMLIPVLLAVSIVKTEFLGEPWYHSGNFLLTGLPFFLLGHYFARKGKAYPRAKYFILPGLVLTLVECIFYHNDVYCYIGTLVLSISLLLTCLACPDARVPQALVFFGRRCSMYMFLIHCAVRDFLYLLIPESPAVWAWIRPLTVLAASILISLGIDWLVGKRKNTAKSAQ